VLELQQGRQHRGHDMINTEDKYRILSGKIKEIEGLISWITPYKDESIEGKLSNQEILDNLISEKNTYSQMLAEL
jgi:hypothetical protein